VVKRLDDALTVLEATDKFFTKPVERCFACNCAESSGERLTRGLGIQKKSRSFFDDDGRRCLLLYGFLLERAVMLGVCKVQVRLSSVWDRGANADDLKVWSSSSLI
tara:strand:+ start:111 stop:428 length:318 start_codon:yes stop_codon:yes gene_type:complete